MYADTFKSHVSKAFNQPIGKVCKFGQICVLGQLELRSEITESYSEEDRKRNVLRQPMRAMRVVWDCL